MRHAQLLAANFAGEDFLALAVFHHRGAVDEDGFHARRMAAHFVGVHHIGKFLADEIVDLVGIEHRHVGGHAFLEHAPIEPQSLGRETGDFVNSLFEAEQMLLARPIAEHFGRRAVPEKPIEVGAHVGADEARVGLDHFRQQFWMGIGKAVIANRRIQIVFQPGVEESVHGSFFR